MLVLRRLRSNKHVFQMTEGLATHPPPRPHDIISHYSSLAQVLFSELVSIKYNDGKQLLPLPNLNYTN